VGVLSALSSRLFIATSGDAFSHPVRFGEHEHLSSENHSLTRRAGSAVAKSYRRFVFVGTRPAVDISGKPIEKRRSNSFRQATIMQLIHLGGLDY